MVFAACQNAESSQHKIKRTGKQEANTQQQDQNPSNNNSSQGDATSGTNQASGNQGQSQDETDEDSGTGSEDIVDQGDEEQDPEDQENNEDVVDTPPKVIPTAGQILDQPGTLALIQADQAFIEQKMREFTGAMPVLIADTQQTLGSRNNRQGKDLALEFLRQEYEALGFVVSLDNYGTGVNFIAEKKGKSAESRVLVLGAHYDSVATVGADDDASGIIGSLAIAQALVNMEFDYTLRVLAFDEEELGLIGSTSYGNSIQANNETGQIIGAIILEMLGFDGNNDSAFHIVDCRFIGDEDLPEGNSGKLSQVVLNAINLSASALQRNDACTDRSDHTSFWNQNIPAVVLSQDFFGGDSNPCYHDACDTIEMIDYTFMASITSAAAMTVASLLTSAQE